MKKLLNNNNNNHNGRSRFVGVRRRASGRWVAEIKESSQKLRLWLGTFDREEEAAMAYDRAARLLRGRNAKTNFPLEGEGPVDYSAEIYVSSVGKNNPRLLHRLLQHAIMRKAKQNMHVRLSSSSETRTGETIVDINSKVSWLGASGVRCCSSKVYSSVFVAPSFGASSVSEVRGD